MDLIIYHPRGNIFQSYPYYQVVAQFLCPPQQVQMPLVQQIVGSVGYYFFISPNYFFAMLL